MTKNTYFRSLRRAFSCVYRNSALNSQMKPNPPAETLTKNDNKLISGDKQRSKSDKVNWGNFYFLWNLGAAINGREEEEEEGGKK